MAAVRFFVPVAFVFLGVVSSSPLSMSEMVENNMASVTQQPMEIENRIVGGDIAAIEDYPHQVSILVNDNSFCGGFIIGPEHIITAAHCFSNQEPDPSKIVVRAGSSFRTNGTIIPLDKVTVHPQYDSKMYDKDAAVMRTSAPINFTKSIQPISLPPKGRQMIANTTYTVSGWGKTRRDEDITEQLMAVEVPVIDRKTCAMAPLYKRYLTDNMFCGGIFPAGGKGTCGGDSGGAAVQDGYAVGIVSFGRCSGPLSPSVLANVAAPAIHDFICENTGLC